MDMPSTHLNKVKDAANNENDSSNNDSKNTIDYYEEDF